VLAAGLQQAAKHRIGITMGKTGPDDPRPFVDKGAEHAVADDRHIERLVRHGRGLTGCRRCHPQPPGDALRRKTDFYRVLNLRWRCKRRRPPAPLQFPAWEQTSL